ncbi:MAG: hypothetical protein JST55_00575 [Bacteroidetes bacterium]|nr:hypothetical protein [Bacteroidota bacterium]
MKPLFLLLFSIVSFTLFAQDRDVNDTKEINHSRDYFSIGLYGGGHVSNSFNVTLGPVNSISGEIEYRKTKNWGFYIKGLYEFVSHDIKQLFYYQEAEYFTFTDVKEPNTFSFLFNFGARYYLTDGNVSPYFQGGLSHETSYMGDYSYKLNDGIGSYSIYKSKAYFDEYLSLDFGVGGKIKLNKKISVDMQADVYQYVGKDNYHKPGYSALIGLKYNL